MDEPTYLDMLKAELQRYEAQRAEAAARADGGEYWMKIVAAWDHAIGVARARIAREEGQS